MVYAILKSDVLHPNLVVRGSAKRLKKAVADVNKLWIQTPAKTRHLVLGVIFILSPSLLKCAKVKGKVTSTELAGTQACSEPIDHIGNVGDIEERD